MEVTDIDTNVKEVSFENKLAINKDAVESLLKRRFFIAPSFSIYGGQYLLFLLGSS